MTTLLPHSGGNVSSPPIIVRSAALLLTLVLATLVGGCNTDQTARRPVHKKTVFGYGGFGSSYKQKVTMAAANGDLDIVEDIVKAHPDALAAEGNYGRTLLHLAARGGHTNVIAFLLANKADVNAQDNADTTPLHAAAAAGQMNAAQMLLDNGANIRARDTFGATPLHDAVRNGQKEIIKFLLANKANINARDNQGQTPLFDAASDGQKGPAILLLASNANINIPTRSGQTPLQRAAQTDNEFMVDLLKASHAKILSVAAKLPPPPAAIVDQTGRLNRPPAVPSFFAPYHQALQERRVALFKLAGCQLAIVDGQRVQTESVYVGQPTIISFIPDTDAILDVTELVQHGIALYPGNHSLVFWPGPGYEYDYVVKDITVTEAGQLTASASKSDSAQLQFEAGKTYQIRAVTDFKGSPWINGKKAGRWWVEITESRW